MIVEMNKCAIACIPKVSYVRLKISFDMSFDRNTLGSIKVDQLNQYRPLDHL